MWGKNQWFFITFWRTWTFLPPKKFAAFGRDISLIISNIKSFFLIKAPQAKKFASLEAFYMDFTSFLHLRTIYFLLLVTSSVKNSGSPKKFRFSTSQYLDLTWKKNTAHRVRWLLEIPHNANLNNIILFSTNQHNWV